MAAVSQLQANMAMQRLLRAKGLYHGRIDGIIGPATHAAMMAYHPAPPPIPVRAAPIPVPLPRLRPGDTGSVSTGVADSGATADMSTIPVVQPSDLGATKVSPGAISYPPPIYTPTPNVSPLPTADMTSSGSPGPVIVASPADTATASPWTTIYGAAGPPTGPSPSSLPAPKSLRDWYDANAGTGAFERLSPAQRLQSALPDVTSLPPPAPPATPPNFNGVYTSSGTPMDAGALQSALARLVAQSALARQ